MRDVMFFTSNFHKKNLPQLTPNLYCMILSQLSIQQRAKALRQVYGILKDEGDPEDGT